MKIDTRSPMHDNLVPRRLLRGLEARVRLMEMGMDVVCQGSVARREVVASTAGPGGARVR